MINQFDYTYNAADMCSSETVSNGLVSTFAKNELVTNSYNALNQLVRSGPSNRIYCLVPSIEYTFGTKKRPNQMSIFVKVA